MNIEINFDILTKANQIIEENKKKKQDEKAIAEYYRKCIEAEICPICGEILQKREATEKEKRNSHFDLIEYVLYCEKSNFKHIVGYYEDDDDN